MGCIETDKRRRLLTAKTSKLVNVGGWQHTLRCQEHMAGKTDRPEDFKLFEALDELVESTCKKAAASGLKEGEDDGEQDAEDAAESDAEPTCENGGKGPEAQLGEGGLEMQDKEDVDDFTQTLVTHETDLIDPAVPAEEEEDEEEEDSQELLSDLQETPQGNRDTLRPNSTLDRELPRPINFRATRWATRNLTFL